MALVSDSAGAAGPTGAGRLGGGPWSECTPSMASTPLTASPPDLPTLPGRARAGAGSGPWRYVQGKTAAPKWGQRGGPVGLSSRHARLTDEHFRSFASRWWGRQVAGTIGAGGRPPRHSGTPLQSRPPWSGRVRTPSTSPGRSHGQRLRGRARGWQPETRLPAPVGCRARYSTARSPCTVASGRAEGRNLSAHCLAAEVSASNRSTEMVPRETHV